MLVPRPELFSQRPCFYRLRFSIYIIVLIRYQMERHVASLYTLQADQADLDNQVDQLLQVLPVANCLFTIYIPFNEKGL